MSLLVRALKMAKYAKMCLKRIGKTCLAFLVSIWLVMPQSVLAEDGTDVGIRQRILDGQLNNDEVNAIRKAVDRALDDAGDFDCDLSVDEILENAAMGRPMDRLDGLLSALLGLLGKEL